MMATATLGAVMARIDAWLLKPTVLCALSGIPLGIILTVAFMVSGSWRATRGLLALTILSGVVVAALAERSAGRVSWLLNVPVLAAALVAAIFFLIALSCRGAAVPHDGLFAVLGFPVFVIAAVVRILSTRS